MIKWTTFATQTDDGQPLIQILNGDLEKTAAYRPDLQEYIGTFEKKADKTYILVNAMTAGEYFGPNLNGDFFPETQLTSYHKTFEKYAYAYRHHVNKDPEKAAGRVIFATYHPEMHRVELVIELDNAKSSDIIERLNKGEFPPVSMGTRTPSDRCSICNNRAKNVASFCNHLKYEMRRIHPDGRRVMAINDDRLTFFDISFVRIPADRTASVITKVAHVEDEDAKSAIPSAVIGEEWLKRSNIKEAVLFKEVPGAIEGFAKDPEGLIMSSRKPLPKAELDKIAEQYSLKDILSTFLVASIVPTPHEFQRIVLINMKRPDLVERVEETMRNLRYSHLLDLGEDPCIPIDVTMSGFEPVLLNKIASWIPDSGMTRPLIMQRVMQKRADLVEAERVFVPAPVDLTGPETHTNLDEPPFPKKKEKKEIKKAANLVDINGPLISNTSDKPVLGPQQSAFSPVKSPFFALQGLGALYMGFLAATKATPSIGTIEKFFRSGQNKWLVPLLMGAMSYGTTKLQENIFNKQAAIDPLHFRDPLLWPRLAITVPGGYVAAGHQENKLQKGKQITKVQDLVRRHPFLTGMAGLWASGVATKGLKGTLMKSASLDRIVYGLGPKQFEQLYADIIGDVTLDNQ